MDQRVWEVLAKIQARKARELLGASDNSVASLAQCLALKLEADGYCFEQTATETEVRLTVSKCPWQELLKKSGRTDVAAAIAEVMCPTEGRVWCAEFGGEYAFSLPSMACMGAEGMRDGVPEIVGRGFSRCGAVALRAVRNPSLRPALQQRRTKISFRPIRQHRRHIAAAPCGQLPRGPTCWRRRRCRRAGRDRGPTAASSRSRPRP